MKYYTQTLLHHHSHLLRGKMDRKVILVILLTLILSAVTVTSFAAPSDVAINKIPSNNPAIDKLLLIEGNTASMSANLENGRLIIKDNIHTQRQVRLNYLEMYKSLKGFNGQTLGYTHIDDNGIITHKVINVGDIDNQGFISLEASFSTVIIDGFTGTTTISLSGLSGNQSISVPNGTSYNFNITNNQAGIVNATGGTLTTDGDYNIHTFYSNGTFTPDSYINIWAFLVGGGGAGGYSNSAGGGGGGGLVSIPSYNLTSQAYPVVVGEGGLITANFQIGENGTESTFNNLTALGGGSGGNWNGNDGLDGGNGGGGGKLVNGLSLLGQGNDGGVGADGAANSDGGGGGGGHGEVGAAGTTSVGGKGGNGSIYNISGTNQWYAGGGGGGRFSGSAGIGGEGGGGDGDTSATNGENGTANTGGGGGGSGFQRGGNGGSGIAIFRYDRNQDAPGNTTITTAVTGDSDTQLYNISETKSFSLTPTGATNNVIFNTTCVDYDAEIIIYWTEDTIKYTETVNDGFANMTIQYTPSFNITSGILNSTYNLIDFPLHDYAGIMGVLVDGVNYNSNATRVGNDVNVSIVNFDTSTHWINFSIPYNPPLDLYSPIDNAVLNFTFPPLNHDVFLSWMSSTGIYKYEIYQGPTIKRSATVFTNSTTVSLPAGDYTWLAYGYDDIFNEYSLDSESFDFTISTNITYTNTTGVHGVVYDYLIGVETPLENAGIYIWNDTFSSSTITSSNGYFAFTGLVNGTYYLIAKKDRYYDSNTEVVTLTTNNMTEHNIRLIENTGTDYNKHYVKFILKSFFGTLYSDVLANVYIGDSTIVFQTDMTGDDGSVTFELTQSQEYRFTFVSVPQSIDITKVITPSDTLYNIIVFGANIIPDPPAQDDILYSVQGININTTQGFINTSFNDTSGTTTFAEVLIKDKNTLAILYQFNTTDNTKDWSQIVDAGNASYVVVFNIDNTILDDTLTITKTVYFDNEVNINLGLENNWSYILIAVIIITTVALLSSRLNAEIMAVITVLTGWSMIFFGWLTAGLPISGKITIWMMMLLATLIAFATVIKKGDR